MAMRIHFARHGESQANLLGEISNRGLKHGLTLKGRQQALALARRLQSRAITRIYSSPLLRAIETSMIVAGKLNLNYEIADALREYDCGILEGRSDSQAWEDWQKLFEAWRAPEHRAERMEGGESFYDIQARFEVFVAELVRSQEEVLCVGHGGLYAQMLPVILKNAEAEFIIEPLKYTDYLTAEVRQGGLFWVEWNGQPMELN